MARSRWTHAICNDCYNKEEPDRIPYTMIDKQQEKCCFCGSLTTSGIYYRKAPEETLCKGFHFVNA